MKHFRLILVFTLFLVPGSMRSAQGANERDSSFILLVVPESDTTMTSSAVYRLSASTNPGRRVTINGKSYKVYPSGAFAGLLGLSVGENRFVVTSAGSAADTISKSFLVIRSKPLETTSRDTLAIEDPLMEPSLDLWLNEGDELRVQFKGTPGCTASFLDGLPMRELSPSENGGLKGVYQGIHKILATDTLNNQSIALRLEDSTGRAVTRQTESRVSFKPREFPMVAVTKADRPALDFGPGEDRLGGAKLSFINPRVRLAITGKVGERYRVALSKNQEAWIKEDQVDILSAGTFPPHTQTGNITVSGDEKFDYITVNMGEKLPYSSDQELEPTRINVDIYGAVSNTNWIVQHNTVREIKNLYYTQVEKDVFRVTIELKHKQVWGYELGYVGNNLFVKIRRQPDRLKVKALTIALDAGHGGPNNGALGSTGSREKDVTFSTVMHLKRLLEKKGARVVLTRSDDTYPLNSERLKTVLASGADILISIHSNSVAVTSNPEESKGVSTYYKYICYRPLSQELLKSVVKTGLTPFANVGSFNFTLNSPTELPNALVELAFISNPEDEMKLMNDEFRKEIAEKIVDGIEDFLDYCDD